MNNFTFYSPTEFVFGKGVENQVGTLCRKYGASRVLVVYGGQSAVKSGLLDRVVESLKAEGLFVATLGGVQPNPTEPKVYEGIELVRKENIDFLLPVGGGSVIDTAKAIAVGVPYDGDFWDFFVAKARAEKVLPVATVLTIPAAGSEGSGNSVITLTTTKQKLGIRYPELLRPKFSIMNPELTMTLPAWQTASGICDMMAHILERYMSNTADVMIGDRLAEGMLLAIIETATRLMKNPDDYEARANIMWCGTIAHNDTCSLGRVEDWSSHAMEHEISAEYNVTHGAGLAVMFPAFLEYMADANPDKVAQLAVRVLEVKASTPDVKFMSEEEKKSVAHEGVTRLRSFFRYTLKMPVTFAQLGIENPDIDLMVARLHKNKGQEFGGYYKLTPEVSKAIYELAL